MSDLGSENDINKPALKKVMNRLEGLSNSGRQKTKLGAVTGAVILSSLAGVSEARASLHNPNDLNSAPSLTSQPFSEGTFQPTTEIYTGTTSISSAIIEDTTKTLDSSSLQKTTSKNILLDNSLVDTTVKATEPMGSVTVKMDSVAGSVNASELAPPADVGAPIVDLSPAQQTELDSSGSGQKEFFNVTQFTVSGAMLDYWNEHGGLAVQGYPISKPFKEVSKTDGKTYTVQYFERSVFQLHEENKGTENEVLLTLVGVDSLKRDFPKGVPKGVEDKSGTFFDITDHYIGNRSKFLDRFNADGGVRQFGLPLTGEIQRVSPTDGNTYTVQYFERAVFESHPDFIPPNDVLGAQVGTDAFQENYVIGPDGRQFARVDSIGAGGTGGQIEATVTPQPVVETGVGAPVDVLLTLPGNNDKIGISDSPLFDFKSEGAEADLLAQFFKVIHDDQGMDDMPVRFDFMPNGQELVDAYMIPGHTYKNVRVYEFGVATNGESFEIYSLESRPEKQADGSMVKVYKVQVPPLTHQGHDNLKLKDDMYNYSRSTNGGDFVDAQFIPLFLSIYTNEKLSVPEIVREKLPADLVKLIKPTQVGTNLYEYKDKPPLQVIRK